MPFSFPTHHNLMGRQEGGRQRTRDSAPAESRGDGGQYSLHDMGIVGNAQLIRDGEQEGVRLGDCVVLLKLFDQDVRFSGVGTAEDRSRGFVKEADLVLFFAASPEIGAITIVGQCEDTAADRNAWSASMARFLPCGAKGANLGGLLDV